MTNAPRSQGAATMLRLVRTTLRDNLDKFIAEHNLELSGTITIAGLADEAIESREEATLDERVLPQSTGGIWARVIDRDETSTISIGEARTTFGLAVTTWINSQSYESDSTVATTAMDGYERVEQLALVVDDTLRSSIRGQGGIYMILPRRSGGRIPRVLRNMPSIHVLTEIYDVSMRTRKPVQGTAAVGEDLGDYAGWKSTELGTQVVAGGEINTDLKLSVATSGNLVAGMLHESPNKLTNIKTLSGVYEVNAGFTVTHSASSSVVHFKFYVDGAEVTGWGQHRTIGTGGDIGNISVRGLVTLAASSYVEIYLQTDKAGTITFNHGSFVAHKIA